MSTKHRIDGTWKKSRRGKYNAKGDRFDGFYFHSQVELARYLQLKHMQAVGTIRRLELQPKFPLTVNGRLICTYIADFRYEAMSPLKKVIGVMVEDVKGERTKDYIIKRKLFEALSQQHIYEIPADMARMPRFATLRAHEIAAA